MCCKIADNGSTLKFENNYFSFSVAKDSGKVVEFINLDNGKNVLDTNEDSFLVAVTVKGDTLYPTSLEIEDGKVKASFDNGETVYVAVEIQDTFMAMEIANQLTYSDSVIFDQIYTTENYETGYRYGGMGMSAYTQVATYGYDVTKHTRARAYMKFVEGTKGAKYGIVFAKDEDYLECMKDLASTIDPKVGLVSKIAGPWTKETPVNYTDYAVCYKIKDHMDEIIEMQKSVGYDQVDIMRGETFRQGEFSFPIVESEKAEDYYKQYGEKFAKAGIATGLHIYAYYISFDSNTMLSTPKWQKQLERCPDSFTLKCDLGENDTEIFTVEDASNFDIIQSFFYKNSPYIIIDEEIIKVKTPAESGFVEVERAQCGTKAAKHSKGRVVEHLSSYFNNFYPVLGSELFYEVADRVADSYNKGGFSMIYVDAIDGINKHVPLEDAWYYYQIFLHRVVSQCHDDPIIEDSAAFSPQEWNIRARQGAWDTASRSLKKFIDNHVARNLEAKKRGYIPTLGWFSFHPDIQPNGGMKNTMDKSLFHDDMDYLGVNAIVHDMTMVYFAFNPQTVREFPYYLANINYYNENYSKIRKANYFTDATKQKIIDMGGEWKVVKKGESDYAFRQMSYHKTKVGNFKDFATNTFTVNNPFGEQKPYVRIESRFSSDYQNGSVLIADFDKDKKLSEQELFRSVKVNMNDFMMISFPVKGTGRDGDALLISTHCGIGGGESGGRIDYFVDLNFEGWRTVSLLDSDNAEYDYKKYNFDNLVRDGADYPTFRVPLYYNDISNVNIRTTGKGADAQIGDIVGYRQMYAPVKNPSVTVNGQTLSFDTTIKGGEYIDYDPETNTAKLYHSWERTVEDVAVVGGITAPNGDFECTYEATPEEDTTVRARVVFGFSGIEITN